MNLDLLPHFLYLFMQVTIIGPVVFVLWLTHFYYLWERRWRILIGTAIICIYALPLDAFAVAHGWGSFNPAYITGMAFFGGALHFEEITFWIGTSFVTISAVMIFAGLQRRGIPVWALPAGILLPIHLMETIFRDYRKSNSLR